MKKHKYFLNFIIIIFNSLVLCSCLSVNRNIKINKNGSGEEVLKITFLKEFYAMISSMTSLMDSSRREGFLDSLYSDEIFINKTKEKYDSIPGIKILDLQSSMNADSSKTFTIKYEFDSIQKIGSSLSVLKDTNDMSQTIVKWKKEDNNILFNYIYEQAGPPVLPANDSLAEQMKKSIAEMFGGGSIHFEIEFPYKIVSSNSTSSEGNRLIWDFPMSEIIINSSMKLEAIMNE